MGASTTLPSSMLANIHLFWTSSFPWVCSIFSSSMWWICGRMSVGGILIPKQLKRKFCIRLSSAFSPASSTSSSSFYSLKSRLSPSFIATMLCWQKLNTALPMDVVIAHSVAVEGTVSTSFTAKNHFWEIAFWLVGSYYMQCKSSIHCTCRLAYFSRPLSPTTRSRYLSKRVFTNGSRAFVCIQTSQNACLSG